MKRSGWEMALMSDPDRNTQDKRGHNWFAEEPEKMPPAADARRRRPEVQPGTAPIANAKPEEVLSINPLGAKKHAIASRRKTDPCHWRRQPNFERVVKIARRFLDPRRARP